MLTIQNVVSLSDFKNHPLEFKGKKPEKKAIRPDPLNRQKVDLKKIDNIGWVFSGGGAKGVFEIGVACALAKAGLLPDVVVGTSVGALNAAAIANGDIDKAVDLWKDISKDKVYKTRISKIIFEGIGQIANWLGIKNDQKVKAVLDNTPLRELLRQELDYEKILDNTRANHVELLMGVLGLNEGHEALFASPELYGKLADRYKDDPVHKIFKLSPENFEDAVIASTSIPVAFPAVKIDDEVFVDGGAGNNTPAKNAIDSLFAINDGLNQGLLFVMLLQPPEDAEGIRDSFTDKNASINRVGTKVLNIVLDNTAKTDVKMAQEITEEIERWEGQNEKAQTTIEKLGQTTLGLKAKAAELLQLSKIIPDESEATKIRKIAKKMQQMSQENLEDTQQLSQLLSDYKPFGAKKKIKIVLIRPEKPFGVDTLEFDKAGQKADEIIQMGYETALSALKQTEVIDEVKYQALMQEEPYPVGNVFKKRAREKGQKLSRLV
jgi:predicted acylesterase/phospholipase RssA